MCGTEQSKEAGDYNAEAFSQAAPEGKLWKRPTRIDYDQLEELEGQQGNPNEQKSRALITNYFNDSDRSTVTSVRSRRQKLGFWSSGGGPMTVGADPYLQKNDILVSINSLDRPDSDFGKVRFESISDKTSPISNDLLDVCQATNSRIFASGPDNKYKSQARARGGFFKDKEFPPDNSSIQGFHRST